ncbi:hypothetical protein HHI36_010863 [Cryptolaemus montrouzieri]|uniref:Nose resistant-to-fluoxetine protein N-terminal domain-containing protein n=1 Tax=Cryptolaemus montrouzieri TaxID=559131 RepID=A0ABD2MJY0_9CUCU
MMRFSVIVFIIIALNINISLCQTCLQRVKNATVEEACSKQLELLCNHEDILFTLWDASSRILHSGLTGTSTNDLGNFDLCMSVDEELDNVTIRGKFCPYEWGTLIPKKKLEEIIARDYRMNTAFDNDQEVSDHLGHNASSDWINVVGSLCLPDSCTVDDFVKVFNYYPYEVKYNLTGLQCITKDYDRTLSTYELVVSICFGVVLLALIVCTTIHLYLHYNERGEPPDFVKAFSVYYNGSKLLTVSTNKKDQVQCMNGMRFLSMLWVIAGHGFAGYKELPHFNEEAVQEWTGHLYSQYIQAAHYAVDTFFFLSGFLLSYNYIKQAEKTSVSKQIKGIPLMYLHRYLRLTPAVAALFFFTDSLLKFLGNGPLWFFALDVVRIPCENNWWRYFLYIQNYGNADICWTQTWYLSADMQMFILAPIVLIPCCVFVKKNLPMVISLLSILTVACVGISIAVAYMIGGYKDNFDTQSRLSDYIVGIIGGIIFYEYKGKPFRISRVVNILLWILTIAIMLVLIIYLHDVTENETQDKDNIFYPLYRPIWSICIMWIVFSCYFGYGGLIDRFLSLPIFQIGARLSYCMYVMHGMIVLISVGETRSYFYFNDYEMYYLFCGHVVTCIAVSVLWTLAFEGPMIVLDKMLFKWIDSLMTRNGPKKKLLRWLY